MYAGANNTELCPTRFFSGDPLYRDGQAPDDAECGSGSPAIGSRTTTRWLPSCSGSRASTATRCCGMATASGRCCRGCSRPAAGPEPRHGGRRQLRADAARSADAGARRAGRYTQVTDGRFKGGYITRRYGQPAAGVHAVQLEMCWSTYMDEQPPYEVDAPRAALLEPLLRALLQAALDWRPGA